MKKILFILYLFSFQSGFAQISILQKRGCPKYKQDAVRLNEKILQSRSTLKDKDFRRQGIQLSTNEINEFVGDTLGELKGEYQHLLSKLSLLNSLEDLANYYQTHAHLTQDAAELADIETLNSSIDEQQKTLELIGQLKEIFTPELLPTIGLSDDEFANLRPDEVLPKIQEKCRGKNIPGCQFFANPDPKVAKVFSSYVGNYQQAIAGQAQASITSFQQQLSSQIETGTGNPESRLKQKAWLDKMQIFLGNETAKNCLQTPPQNRESSCTRVLNTWDQLNNEYASTFANIPPLNETMKESMAKVGTDLHRLFERMSAGGLELSNSERLNRNEYEVYHNFVSSSRQINRTHKLLEQRLRSSTRRELAQICPDDIVPATVQFSSGSVESYTCGDKTSQEDKDRAQVATAKIDTQFRRIAEVTDQFKKGMVQLGKAKEKSEGNATEKIGGFTYDWLLDALKSVVGDSGLAQSCQVNDQQSFDSKRLNFIRCVKSLGSNFQNKIDEQQDKLNQRLKGLLFTMNNIKNQKHIKAQRKCMSALTDGIVNFCQGIEEEDLKDNTQCELTNTGSFKLLEDKNLVLLTGDAEKIVLQIDESFSVTDRDRSLGKIKNYCEGSVEDKSGKRVALAPYSAGIAKESRRRRDSFFNDGYQVPDPNNPYITRPVSKDGSFFSYFALGFAKQIPDGLATWQRTESDINLAGYQTDYYKYAGTIFAQRRALINDACQQHRENFNLSPDSYTGISPVAWCYANEPTEDQFFVPPVPYGFLNGTDFITPTTYDFGQAT